MFFRIFLQWNFLTMFFRIFLQWNFLTMFFRTFCLELLAKKLPMLVNEIIWNKLLSNESMIAWWTSWNWFNSIFTSSSSDATLFRVGKMDRINFVIKKIKFSIFSIKFDFFQNYHIFKFSRIWFSTLTLFQFLTDCFALADSSNSFFSHFCWWFWFLSINIMCSCVCLSPLSLYQRFLYWS